MLILVPAILYDECIWFVLMNLDFQSVENEILLWEPKINEQSSTKVM
jgi:hypothetical protein